MQIVHINVDIVGRAHICCDLELPDGLSDFQVLTHINDELNEQLHAATISAKLTPGSGKTSSARAADVGIASMVPYTGMRIIATFYPQAWQNDDAVDVDAEGTTDIDVTAEILAMGVEAAKLIEDGRDSSDAFKHAAMAPQWIRDWDGPFRINVEGSIDDYVRSLGFGTRRSTEAKTPVADGKRIIATFVPQILEDGQFISIAEHETRPLTFDVTPQLVFMGRTKAMEIQDGSFEAGQLRGLAPDWIREWDGYYSIEVEESVQAYFDNPDNDVDE